MKKPSRKKLEKECYSLWAEIVKLLAHNRSEISGKTGVLHAHHIFHRGSNTNLRYDLNNGVCLTSGEHFKLHMQGMPELVTLLIEKRGKIWYNVLMEKRREPTIKRTISDITEIRDTLKSILENKKKEIK